MKQNNMKYGYTYAYLLDIEKVENSIFFFQMA